VHKLSLRTLPDYDDKWRAHSDGLGELHVFCRECWEREFGENA